MKGRSIFTKDQADQIVKLIRQKLRADSATQKVIRNKIRRLGFYASDFGLRGGYDVQDFLNSVKITKAYGKTLPKVKSSSPKAEKEEDKSKSKAARLNASDESYVIDLCDKVLKRKAKRQHKFDFLRGDPGKNGTRRKLPVDAYYRELNLVVEYREKQHTESVPIMDKRMTISGITRGEQRKRYDERRRKVLPKNGIKLVEISYSDFKYDGQKRIVKSSMDVEVVMEKLREYLK